MMQVSAIIVAAGSGTRLRSSLPKAFVPLAGQAMLFWSLRTLGSIPAIGEIIVTVPEGMERAARAIVSDCGLEPPVKIIEGGHERQDSVRLALALTSAEAELCLVHDAARPFASALLFQRCIGRAAVSGGAIAAVPVADTLKRAGPDSRIAATIPRGDLWQAQTPQAFDRKLLIRAHQEALELRIMATDDADLIERLGYAVEVVEGSPMNLKITTPDDLTLADALAVRLFPH